MARSFTEEQKEFALEAIKIILDGQRPVATEEELKNEELLNVIFAVRSTLNDLLVDMYRQREFLAVRDAERQPPLAAD